MAVHALLHELFETWIALEACLYPSRDPKGTDLQFGNLYVAFEET